MKELMKETIRAAITANYEDVATVCHSLYAHPESANEEFESAKKIEELLRRKGFAVEEHYAGLPTAFRATKCSGTGPRVAIPVEYDALPGIGHACGHHLICGMSLLAGISLAEVLSKYSGEVTLFGTPAEETGEGKPPMVDAGYFDDYDVGIMLHPHNDTCVEPSSTSIGVYDISFHGQTAHCGLAPFEGVNALDAVVMMYNGVSMMRQQLRDGTRIAGIVLSGGEMTNSIPDSCVIRYEIRTLDMDYYDHVMERLKHCAEAAATATGCTMEWKLSMPICSALVPSPSLADAFRDLLAEYGQRDSANQSEPLCSDMGEVATVIPTLHPIVKMTEGTEKLHTPEFLVAANKPYAWEKMGEYGEMLALLGLRVFEDENLLKTLRAEREEKRANRSRRARA